MLAITDHGVFIPHNELSDADFLMLNGIEYRCLDEGNTNRQCHFCAIAGSEETVLQPMYHRTKYTWAGGNEARALVRFDESLPDYERVYSARGVCEMMQNCRDAGFFVTYNHPAWSLERYPDYMGYEGMHAMEIFNYRSADSGYPEMNESVYDDMLMGGKRLFCIATDDNHTAESDAFGGYTVIGAKRLAYKDIADALFEGRFYASTGAEMDEMYVEDGMLYVKTPPAREIRVFTGNRYAARLLGTREAPVTEMCFDVSDPRCRYFRVVVTDFEGKQAFSRAYFPQEIGNFE